MSPTLREQIPKGKTFLESLTVEQIFQIDSFATKKFQLDKLIEIGRNNLEENVQLKEHIESYEKQLFELQKQGLRYIYRGEYIVDQDNNLRKALENTFI